MKIYETKDIRNVGIVGHGHSGKTSVVAGLLYAAGATSRLTRVDEGNTVTDYDEEEIQRKLTISTALAAIEWKKTKINILDTPGFNMFVNDARATLIAADAAIVVIDAISGVEAHTEKMWESPRNSSFRAPSSSTSSIAIAPASNAPSKASTPASAAPPFPSSFPSEATRTSGA